MVVHLTERGKAGAGRYMLDSARKKKKKPVGFQTQ